jgi:replication-associated recombination protein RarA
LNPNESIEKYISSRILLKPPLNFSDIYDFTLKRTLQSEIKQKWNKCITINYRLFLLYGPKGCGKTLISQALISDNKFKFYMIDSMEQINNINNFMLNLHKVLNYNHPICLFIKNLEALLPKLTQIDFLIDKILEYEDNVVIVSTNVDPNRLPNDFMNKHKMYFFVGAVKPQDKINYVKFMAKKLNVKLDVDNNVLFDFCASKLVNFNNEDVKNLIVLAKEIKNIKAKESINGDSVDIDDLMDAKNKVAGNLTMNVIKEFYQNKNNPDSYF